MTATRPARRGRRRVVIALVVSLTAAQAGVADAAESPSQLRSQRRAVQTRRARASASVNVLAATDRQLDRALVTLQNEVRSRETAVASARRSLASAERRVGELTAAQDASRRHLGDVRRLLTAAAIDQFVRGVPASAMQGPVPSAPADQVRKAYLGRIAVLTGRDLADVVRQAEEDLRHRREEAEAAAALARRRRSLTETELQRAMAAHQAEQRVADGVEARLERQLAEAAALESLDRSLAARIANAQARLARRIAPRARAGGSTRRIGEANVVSVRGIVVARSLAPRLSRLLADADGAGLQLSGGGYRSPSQQVASRRSHCGSSDYDIYRKPASQCRPPSARPGQSMHERGLAIDFTDRGRIIGRSSRAYGWLRANAGRYGLRNLPSEPWHWSTNGR